MSSQLVKRALARRRVSRSAGITIGLLCICLLVAAGAMLSDNPAGTRLSTSTLALNDTADNSAGSPTGGLASDAEVNVPAGQTDGTNGSTTGTDGSTDSTGANAD